MIASTNCRMPRPSSATADSNQRPNAAICGVISAKAAPTFTEARRQNRSSGSPMSGQLPMLSGGGGIARFPAVKRSANPCALSARVPASITVGPISRMSINRVNRVAAIVRRLPRAVSSGRYPGWTATAMMMPHTTGTMNGRTIWKHQATSRATRPMRIAASTALRTKIRSVRDPGRVVTLQFLAED